MGGLVPLMEQVAADNPGAAPTAISVIAEAHAEANRLDEARRRLENFASKGFELPIDMIWTAGMTMCAEAAIECREAKYAQPLLDRLTPYAHRLSYNPATAEGPVGHFLGGLAAVLGRYDEADTYFSQAAAFSNRVGAKFFAARANLSWAGMLAKRCAPGDAEKAQELPHQGAHRRNDPG
jgi:hypothetical protein